MQLITNCAFLENELLDVARLFPNRPQVVSHAFVFQDGVFFNEFTIDGENYSFKDVGQVQDELIYKRLERRFAKLRLYEILSEKYGKKMPWGALTGIRPTKLAYTEMERGGDYKALFNAMHVEKENIRLIEQILSSQQGIYEKKDGNTELFISLPFCPTKCAYCSFITAPIDKTRAFIPSYLDALKRELCESESLIGNLRGIYIGGGTPFAIEADELKKVLESTAPIFAKNSSAEYTVEAGRPDVFTDEKLKLLQDYGVNRICINPQTFSNETLKKIGRKHTVEDFYKAYDMAKKYGFDVNIDLIAGLTDESVESFVNGVEQAKNLQAENITVHCLSLKSGAKLKEECSYIENDEISKMILASREILESGGYAPYYMYRQKYQAGNNENTGWTKPHKACVYNIDVMEETTDNLAVGANAISKRVYTGAGKIERLGAPKDIKTYLETIDETLRKKREFFEK